MDNKLSELSKPVQIFKHPSGRNFWSVSADSNAGQQDVEAFYSQEYVSALLAELESKDQRIIELEAKLATPVRLPLLYSPDPWMSPDPDGTWLDKEDVKKSIRTAGFTVEGDE